MADFGHKYGKGFGNRAAHPYPVFVGSTPFHGLESPLSDLKLNNLITQSLYSTRRIRVSLSCASLQMEFTG